MEHEGDWFNSIQSKVVMKVPYVIDPSVCYGGSAETFF